MADTDWALAKAPLYRLPADKRQRLALHVAKARTYTRPGGVVVPMAADHFVVWSAWHRNDDGQLVGDRLPAYIPRETWARTYANERPAADGLIFADKTNGVRAAIYTGRGPARMLVNENDPSKPESWAAFQAGDHLVLAVDARGRPITYVGDAGMLRNDQYPIHGDNWPHLGYQPVQPLSTGVEPKISRAAGPVVLVPSRLAEIHREADTQAVEPPILAVDALLLEREPDS